MKEIVPLISSRTTGPLGVAHLPRLWLKLILHATGRLPEGYRHGTGGSDQRTFENLGIDGGAFIAFVTSTLPTYPQCEAWVRDHATKLDSASIAAHNELLSFEKPEAMAAHQRAFAGIDDPGLRNGPLLNDLDDWATVHAQITTGELPPLLASSLNAALSEMLKELLDATQASRTTIRLDMEEFGFEPTRPTAEAVRPGVPSILNQVRKDMHKSGTIAFMKRERRLLIQDDLLHPSADALPPTELIEVYETYAQMLGPVFHGDKLVAWISVHENTGARHWTPDDAQALTRAVEVTQSMLDRIAGIVPA